MNKISIFLFVNFFICTFCSAQDSVRTLNAEQIILLVKKFHPLAAIAGIGVEKAKADILVAQGAFDPVLSVDAGRKTFDRTNYYDYFSPEIMLPTWYGVEFFGGIESLTGFRLDPTLTKGQSSYLGVSIPLAKDLLIDKRRAYLKQSKIFATMASVEQKSVLNDLLMDALEAYWNWVKNYQTYIVVQNNVAVNERRLELVKKSFFNGERPAIDTIEALAQLQGFQVQSNSRYLEFQNAGLELSAFCWKKNGEPYELPSGVVPESAWENEVKLEKFNLSLPDLMAVANSNHPDLTIYQLKLSALDINKKLKFQELLPKLDFRYNQLGKGYNLLNTALEGPLFENNYQYGIKFEMPLRLSEGRGNYKNAKLKIEETKLLEAQKRLAIQLKIKNYYNEFVNLKNQILVQSRNFDNYQKLVKAEEKRLSNGESSLFIINSRENKALEALEKLIELKTKYFKTIYTLQWSAGLLQL